MNNSDSQPQTFAESDHEAFAELYRQHHRLVYSICFRMTQNAADSEDLTQEVFIQVFRTIGSFRGESLFTTWLHRLTVNHVLMHFRKRKVRPELTTENGEIPVRVETGSNDPKRMRVVDNILLAEVMAKLPEGYREAIILHDIVGFQHTEIAERRGRSVGTSKSQLHKARILLRALLTRGVRPQPVHSPSLTSTVCTSAG